MAERKQSRARTRAESRAETPSKAVREKRTSRKPARTGRERKPVSAKTEETGRPIPPVLVRRSTYAGSASAARSKKARTPRRRFDVELSAPGVEIRLPALPAVKLGWRLVSFVLVVGLLGLSYYLLTAPTYQVQAAELQGVNRLTAADLNQVMQIWNKSIFTIDPVALEQALQTAYPELTDIEIRVGLPATVQVQIEERTPVIAWQEQGRTRWIDLAGIDFTPRGEVEGLISVQAYGAPPAPFVTPTPADVTDPTAAAKQQPFIKPEIVQVILDLAQHVPPDSILVYDPQHGLGWHDPRGWDVYFGMDTVDIQMKLTVYQAIVDELQSKGITPALINVEHVHAPYYRMER